MEEEDVEQTREPEMYRWISNAAGLSFSVPVGVLPSASTEDDQMVVDSSTSLSATVAVAASRPPPNEPPLCDVGNCTAPRKYRLVSNWQMGACGMGHLKVLQEGVRS